MLFIYNNMICLDVIMIDAQQC